MLNTIKVVEVSTGIEKVAVYAPDRRGNMVYHIDGKPVPDKVFDKKYKIITE